MLSPMLSRNNPLAESESVDLSTEYDSLLEGALTSLKVFESWCRASTDHPQLQGIIQSIHGHTVAYLEVIDDSIKTAQDGYRSSCDAADVYDDVIDPDTRPDNRRLYITEIQSKVKCTLQGTMMMWNKFRDVHMRLTEIAQTLPKEVLASSETRLFSRWFSPLVGDRRDISLDTAVSAQNLVVLDIAMLAGHIDKFADWWGRMEVTMKGAEIGANKIDSEEDKLQRENMAMLWAEIINGYKLYNVQVIQLQDYYTPHVHFPWTQPPKRGTSTRFSLDGHLAHPEPATSTEFCALVESTFNSLHIIEHWRGASTDHPHLQGVVQRIQNYNLVFFEAIDASIKTAKDGYLSSCDSIELCRRRVSSQIGTDNTQEYTCDMQSKTKRVHDDHLIALNNFESVRNELTQIMKSIPQDLLRDPNQYDLNLDSEIGVKVLDLAKIAENVDRFIAWWSTKKALDGLELTMNFSGRWVFKKRLIKTFWETIRDNYKEYYAWIIRLQDHYTPSLLSHHAHSVESCQELCTAIKGAYDRIYIAEFKRGARYRCPEPQETSRELQNATLSFLEAVEMSVKVVQDGYRLICDTIELCHCLLDTDDDPNDHQESIIDIQSKTDCAHGDSLTTMSIFMEFRHKLTKVANSIPDEDLSGLLDNVDSFIDWWKIRLRAFTEICCLANYLKPGMGGLGVLSMQKISGGIRDDYKQYKDQVVQLQYSYAQDLPIDSDNTNPCKEACAMVDIAFSSLEHWRPESTNRRQLGQVVPNMQSHAKKYFETISASNKAAQDGYRIGCDAVDICRQMISQEFEPEYIRKSIESIQNQADCASDDFLAIFNQFMGIRHGLAKTIKALQKIGPADPNEEFLVVDAVRDAEISIAVEQPDLTLSHAATLAGNVDRFVDWWSKILPIANDAKYLAGCLKPEIRVFGVLLMQAVSGGIRDACKQYKDQVIRLEDSSPQDPLAELEGIAPCKELSSIVEDAFNTLQIIEPWNGAATDHPVLRQAIQKIQGHALVYFDAIDASVGTAQDGYAFSCDAIELCGYILDPDADPSELQEYILDMQSKAKLAHDDSVVTLNKFREVRKGLIEITKEIPKEALESQDSGKRFIDRLFSSKKGAKRDLSLDTAMKKLNLAALDMARLVDNVDKFAGWWGEMEMVLKKAGSDVAGLKAGKNRLRVKGVQKTWTIIRDDYKQYKVQIIQLQDYYPQGREIKSY